MTTPQLPWLDACIDILLGEPRGAAHVDVLVRRLARWNVKDSKPIITRTLNSYCSDAADFQRHNNPDLFKRVAPNTFELRSFPVRPDTRFLMKEQRRQEAEILLRELGLL